MLLFRCDYAEGAHPEILKRLTETNFEQLDGYGNDPYTRNAKRKILEACHCPEGEVHLLVGRAPQANATVIAAMLADYEGAVSSRRPYQCP
jgi:Threonine aldolase